MTTDRYFDAATETMPREGIAALQEERLLGDILPRAYEGSALVRAAWDAAGVTPSDIGSIADFVKLAPFLDKDAIRAHRDRYGDPYGGLLATAATPEGGLSAIFSTSGTTGDPTPAPYGNRGPSPLCREFWEMGVRPGDNFLHMLFTFRGPGIHETIRGIGATPLFLDHHPNDFAQLFRWSREYAPTGGYALSGPMIMALQYLAPQMGVDLAEVFASYRGMIFAGEPLGERARATVESWGLTLFQHTAVGDAGAATECQEHDGHHIWEDTVLVECLDLDTGEPVPDGGRGELVVTTLVDGLAPLVRFRSDDIVRLTTETCGCGRTHARMWPLGRRGDEVLVAGRSILPAQIWSAVESVEATSAGLFQLIRPQRELETLRLRVGHGDVSEGSLPELRGKVADAVEEAVGVRPEVELVTYETLLKQGPPHKIPRVTKS